MFAFSFLSLCLGVLLRCTVESGWVTNDEEEEDADGDDGDCKTLKCEERNVVMERLTQM